MKSKSVNLFKYGVPETSEIDIEMGRRHLLDFIKVSKPDYEVNWHHTIVCEEVEEFLRDPDRDRLMLFMPPRRGKSEIVSRRLPAFILGRNPNINIMLGTYGADLSNKICRAVQRVIDSDIYGKIFPNTQLNTHNVKNTSQSKYVRTADTFEVVGHSGVFKSAGIGGAFTGQGADLFIIDDPHKDMKEATSPTSQKAALDWFDAVASTRLSKIGKIIMILTRWDSKDLAGRLLSRSKKIKGADSWDVICLPELFEYTEYTHPDDPREEGESLWPSWFKKKNVLQIKAAAKSVFASLYQQRPYVKGGTIVKRGWFKFYNELPPKFDYIKLSMDCAFKDQDDSDYVVIAAFGILGSKKYMLPYLVREKLSFKNTIQELIKMLKKYPDYQELIIEEKANGSAVISVIEDHVRGIYAYNPTDSKVARLSSVTPDIHAGDVLLPEPLDFPEANEWVETFLTELSQFPRGENDDMCDALSQLLIRCRSEHSWVEKLAGEEESDESNVKGFLSKIFGVSM